MSNSNEGAVYVSNKLYKIKKNMEQKVCYVQEPVGIVC